MSSGIFSPFVCFGGQGVWLGVSLRLPRQPSWCLSGQGRPVAGSVTPFVCVSDMAPDWSSDAAGFPPRWALPCRPVSLLGMFL